MSRHLADKQSPSTGAGLKAFMQIARQARGIESQSKRSSIWHRNHHNVKSSSRLVQFLRLERETFCE